MTTGEAGDDPTERARIAKAFAAAVNMTAAELEAWLKTPESRSVGFKHEGEGEAVGHAEGRRIVALKRKTKGDLTDEDLQHMQKTVGYVHRHLAQGGPEDKDAVATSRWRYSLKNWGHDPLKD